MVNDNEFKRHLHLIERATTIKELHELSKFRDEKGILREWFTMKFFNKEFRGNFKKAKTSIIQDARGYNNACEDELFNNF